MEIQGPAHVHGAQPINAPHSIRRDAATTQPASPLGGNDELTISTEGDFLSRISDLPEVRQDRVDQIRQQIANGTYETGDKLDTALDRLLDEIG